MVSRTIQLGLASVILAAAGAASAQQTTYDYTGTPMSGTVFGTFVGPDGEFGSYPYCCTTLDGSMTLSSPLAPNLNDAVVDPLALTFGFTTIGGPIGAPAGSHPDGAISSTLGGSSRFTMAGLVIYAADLSNPNDWLATATVGGPPTPFLMSTNSQGQITSWSLQVGTFNETASSVVWNANLSSATGDSLFYQTLNHGPDNRLSNSTPGAWSVVTSRSVPEIDPGSAGAALTMLGTLIAILCGRRRTLSSLIGLETGADSR